MAVERQGVWRRCDLYTILFIPPGEWHVFAVVRLLQGEVEYDEPGDAQFKPERFDHVSLAVDRAHERSGRGPGRKLEYPVVGPAPGHRPEGVRQLRMGPNHAGAASPGAFPRLDGRRGGSKVRSRHCRSSASAWRSAERHSGRANSQDRPAGMMTRICRTCSGVQ